ncbi:MAG: 16S rRNA (uracil(1498)-N(3))-methyltransferase [Planctomycetota bacterium]|jgi:16S rRNA (uracil1498-N3)-methyltransferase
MHRFFVEKSSFAGNEVVLKEKQSHQICNVLRIREGEKIIVLDNTGFEFEIELIKVNKKLTSGKIIEKRPAAGEPKAKLTLYQSMLSREKFEFVLQKCTEIGVSRFVPIVTQRSVVRDTAIKKGKLERWRNIIMEAAEQSGRGLIPELRAPIDYSEAIVETEDFDMSLIACTKRGRELHGSLALVREDGYVSLFIGPEGGFADEEVELCLEEGAMPVTLGRRILRTETAGVVASALVLYELGEME